MLAVKQSQKPVDKYIEGFLSGRALAYCEMVERGVRLAGCFDCDADYLDAVLEVIATEGCKVIVKHQKEVARASVWIYRHPRVESLIHALEDLPGPSPLTVWATGKIFGYGDVEVLDYLPLITSATESESSQRRDSRTSCASTEPACYRD